MLTKLLTIETIQLQEHVATWQEAITLAAQPLVDNQSIRREYIGAMIASVEEFGPYIVIAPLVALPHARPEEGALKVGVSLLKLNQSVSFSNDSEHEVNLLIVLSATDNSSHIGLLTALSELLGDEEIIQSIIMAESKSEIIQIIQSINLTGV